MKHASWDRMGCPAVNYQLRGPRMAFVWCSATDRHEASKQGRVGENPSRPTKLGDAFPIPSLPGPIYLQGHHQPYRISATLSSNTPDLFTVLLMDNQAGIHLPRTWSSIPISTHRYPSTAPTHAQIKHKNLKSAPTMSRATPFFMVYI